jgi:hypothetical protein
MANIPIIDAPKNNDLNDFRAVLGRYSGLSKTNKFVVQIVPSVALVNMFEGAKDIIRDLQFLCEVSELPGRSIATSEVRYYGPSVKFPFQTAYTEISLTFICRGDLFERDFFDSWMQYINPIKHYDFRYKDDYATTVHIFQYSDVAEDYKFLDPVYQISLENAFPINLNPQQLVWADDSYHRIGVTLNYDRWYRAGERDKNENEQWGNKG